MVFRKSGLCWSLGFIQLPAADNNLYQHFLCLWFGMVWKNRALANDFHCYFYMGHSGSTNQGMDETIPVWSGRMGLEISYLLESSANEKAVKGTWFYY